MHEMTLVASLLDLIENTSREHGLQGVNRVFLKVGAMALVEPMTLRAAFEVACEGTVADGAEIVIENVPATSRCGHCATAFTVEKFNFVCPDCGSERTTLITGKEFSLDRLEAISV